MHQSDCYQRIKSRKDGGKDRNLKTRKNKDLVGISSDTIVSFGRNPKLMMITDLSETVKVVIN